MRAVLPGRGEACHGCDGKSVQHKLWFSFKGSSVEWLITDPVFPEMAVKLAIFMQQFIAGQLSLHVLLQAAGPGRVTCGLL